MMTVTYPVGRGLYVNLTNRCPCACTFCLRQNGDGVYGSDSLWLEREPTVREVCDSIDAVDPATFDELVFCGYGEPTERLPDLLEVAAHSKAANGKPVRINTNGLSDLIWNRPTAPLLAGKIDVVSISLNALDAQSYVEVVRPRFGLPSYDAMLRFAKACTAYVPKVVMTVVDGVTTPEQQVRAREICASIGAVLRVRPFEH